MEEEDLFLFIADVSGYASFMLSNQTAYKHAVLVTTELMEALVRQIGLPLKISKMEGDALFFYLQDGEITEEMRQDPHLISRKLLQIIDLFSNKVADLQASTTCQCGGCANIGNLHLKIIVHFGKASIVTIGKFYELSGLDVILTHRLLKNHIQGHRYILLTEQAAKQISFPKEVPIEKLNENIPDIGKIPISVCLLAKKENEKKPSWIGALARHARLFIGATLLKWKIKKPLPFLNLPSGP